MKNSRICQVVRNTISFGGKAVVAIWDMVCRNIGFEVISIQRMLSTHVEIGPRVPSTCLHEVVNATHPSMLRLSVTTAREILVDTFEIVNGKTDLFEIVTRRHLPRSGSRVLDGHSQK